MIKIFSATDKTYNTNGDIVVNPLYAVIHKEDNGEYYLEIETGLAYIDYFKDGNIITADTPQGLQEFRITNTDITKSRISAKCNHVYYDTNNYLIQDSYVRDKNCDYAIKYLNDATDNESPFNVYSDIESINSYRCVRTSLNEAIGVLIEKYGGHLVRNNWNIGILENIGQDNGVTVRYKKNLRDITCETIWDEVVTKLLPVGNNGIMLNELDEHADVYIYSNIQYDIPYTKTVSFAQDLNADDYPSEQAYTQALVDDLRAQATAYIDLHDKPQVNYTLSANLDVLTDIGDVIEVIDERLGVNILTNVIAFDYDVILGRYTEVQFGNFTPNLSNLMSNINSAIDTATSDLQISVNDEIKTATGELWDVLESYYIVQDGDKILILDRLPKEDAENVIKLSNSGFSISKSGIDGTYNPFYSIDGVFMLGGTNDKNSILRAFNENNEEILTIDKNGLKIANKSVYEALYYATNDTETLNGAYTTGFCTDNAQKITFTIQLSKSAEDITTITADILKLNIIKTNNNFVLDSGYIAGGYNVLTDATITTSITKINDKTLTIELTKQGGFNADNNAPLFVNIDELTLSFN
jgi:phage minor structural protein